VVETRILFDPAEKIAFVDGYASNLRAVEHYTVPGGVTQRKNRDVFQQTPDGRRQPGGRRERIRGRCAGIDIALPSTGAV
jgi:elongation factor P hydroxylase